MIVRPAAWFFFALALLTAGGAYALGQPWAILTDPSKLKFYWSLHLWQSSFDALSAAAGCGLLLHDYAREYTAAGRWVLTGLGVAGAVLYLAAAAAAIRPRGASASSASPWAVALLFLFWQIPLAGLACALEGLSSPHADVGAAMRRSLAAFASVGLTEPLPTAVARWSTVLIGWLGALGWFLWLSVLPTGRLRAADWRRVLLQIGGYTMFLLGAAALLLALESPRTSTVPYVQPLQPAPLAERAEGTLARVVAASGAGRPLPAAPERDRPDGTAAVLALVLLVGGLGGSAGGGLKWTTLTTALRAVSGGLWRGAGIAPASSAQRLALTHVVLMTNLVLVIALGLLAIETFTASRFESPHTFAEALLDATSAVAGGGLSSGVTTVVTSESLSSGMRQDVDQYQYGMVWLMLGMLAGRVLPLLVFDRRGLPADSAGPLP